MVCRNRISLSLENARDTAIRQGQLGTKYQEMAFGCQGFTRWHGLNKCYVAILLKPGRRGMSKQADREETERLIKEAMARKTITIKQGDTRIEAKCGKCGAPNRV